MKYCLMAILLVLSACKGDDPIPLTYEQQLAFDKQQIDQYLAANNITNVVKDSSGLRYVIHTLGTGPVNNNLESRLKVQYNLRMLSATTILDASGEPLSYFDFPMSQMIKGWQVAFSQLPVGTEVTLYIPSGLAYGTRGGPGLPPNANLVFEVAYLDFFNPNAPIYDADGNFYTAELFVPGVWLTGNLRTASYENGETIALTDWSHYNGNIGFETEFGKLYTFSAATDVRGVCPEGYRLPRPEEFEEVSTSFFSSLDVGGSRNASGVYSGMSDIGVYWTSQEVDGTNDAIAYTFSYTAGFVQSAISKDSQVSIVCIKGH